MSYWARSVVQFFNSRWSSSIFSSEAFAAVNRKLFRDRVDSLLGIQTFRSITIGSLTGRLRTSTDYPMNMLLLRTELIRLQSLSILRNGQRILVWEDIECNNFEDRKILHLNTNCINTSDNITHTFICHQSKQIMHWSYDDY